MDKDYHNPATEKRFGKVMHIFHRDIHKGRSIIYQRNSKIRQKNCGKTGEESASYPHAFCRHNLIISDKGIQDKKLQVILRKTVISCEETQIYRVEKDSAEGQK